MMITGYICGLVTTVHYISAPSVGKMYAVVGWAVL